MTSLWDAYDGWTTSSRFQESLDEFLRHASQGCPNAEIIEEKASHRIEKQKICSGCEHPKPLRQILIIDTGPVQVKIVYAYVVRRHIESQTRCVPRLSKMSPRLIFVALFVQITNPWANCGSVASVWGRPLMAPDFVTSCRCGYSLNRMALGHGIFEFWLNAQL